METNCLHSTLLLGAILVPLLAGLVLLFSGSLAASLRRIIALSGFGIPLVAALFLAFNFDSSLAGGYNFRDTNRHGSECGLESSAPWAERDFFAPFSCSPEWSG